MHPTSPAPPKLKAIPWPRAAIAAGYHHSVGMRLDGTVIAAGENKCGQCDVDGWNFERKEVEL